jgi:hypothetical protein
MRHPADGTLRRLVDDPSGVADREREHVAHCPSCLSRLAAAQRDAELAATALGVAPAADVDTAWHRLSSAVAVDATAGAARRAGERGCAAPSWPGSAPPSC